MEELNKKEGLLMKEQHERGHICPAMFCGEILDGSVYRCPACRAEKRGCPSCLEEAVRAARQAAEKAREAEADLKAACQAAEKSYDDYFTAFSLNERRTENGWIHFCFLPVARLARATGSVIFSHLAEGHQLYEEGEGGVWSNRHSPFSRVNFLILSGPHAGHVAGFSFLQIWGDGGWNKIVECECGTSAHTTTSETRYGDWENLVPQHFWSYSLPETGAIPLTEWPQDERGRFLHWRNLVQENWKP